MKPRVPGANHYKAIILHKIWNDVFRWYDASCEVSFVVTLEFHIKDVGVQLHASKAISLASSMARCDFPYTSAVYE